MPPRQRKHETQVDGEGNSVTDVAQKQEKKPEKKKGWSWGDIGTNIFMLAMLGYAFVVGRNIYGIFQPVFPDTYPNGQPMPKFKNTIEPGTVLHARVWTGPKVPTVSNRKPHASDPPDWEFDFPYGYAHGFESHTKTVAVTIPENVLSRHSNVHIYADVVPLSANGDYEKARAIASAKGDFIKYTNPPVPVPKYKLLSGEVRKSRLLPCRYFSVTAFAELSWQTTLWSGL